MGKIKVIAPQNNFTQVANAVIRDRSLTWQAVGLLCWLKSHSSEFDLSLEFIYGCRGHLHGGGEDGVKKAIRNLKDCGYLKISKVKNDKGQFGDYEWQLFDSPEKPDENPTVGNSRLREKSDFGESRDKETLACSLRKPACSKTTTGWAAFSSELDGHLDMFHEDMVTEELQNATAEQAALAGAALRKQIENGSAMSVTALTRTMCRMARAGQLKAGKAETDAARVKSDKKTEELLKKLSGKYKRKNSPEVFEIDANGRILMNGVFREIKKKEAFVADIQQGVLQKI